MENQQFVYSSMVSQLSRPSHTERAERISYEIELQGMLNFLKGVFYGLRWGRIIICKFLKECEHF